MPGTLRSWRAEEGGDNYDTFVQEIVDDGGRRVLRMETYPAESWPEQPRDSHFSFRPDPHRRTINASRTYEIEYRFKIVEGGPDAAGMGITFRYYSEDTDDRTAFTYYPAGFSYFGHSAGGYINIHYPDGSDGGDDFFDLGDAVNLENGTWYTMRILCEPDRFTMFLDGTLFFEHQDEHELYEGADVWWSAYSGVIVHIDTIRIAYVDDPD